MNNKKNHSLIIFSAICVIVGIIGINITDGKSREIQAENNARDLISAKGDKVAISNIKQVHGNLIYKENGLDVVSDKASFDTVADMDGHKVIFNSFRCQAVIKSIGQSEAVYMYKLQSGNEMLLPVKIDEKNVDRIAKHYTYIEPCYIKRTE